jgi:hypothetical protein
MTSPPPELLTILGYLLSFYFDERSQKDLEGLKDWINENSYGYMLTAMDANEELGQEITDFMSQNQEEIRVQLSIITDSIYSLASRMEGTKGIATSLHTYIENKKDNLSDQSISILRQFVQSGGTYIWHEPDIEENSVRTNVLYCAINGKAEEILVEEERHLIEDIETLYTLGFIEYEGPDKYTVTRAGVNFIKKINIE